MNINKLLAQALSALFIFQLPIMAMADSPIYFVVNDHLGTPQVLVDEESNVVWQTGQDEFGEGAPEVEDIEFNIRFPGQYYDKETGTHYNYYRDYNPSLGRYLQSDPIGLGGGLNTYGYVQQNPLEYIDPRGLNYVPYVVPPVTPINHGDLSGYGLKSLADTYGVSICTLVDFLIGASIAQGIEMGLHKILPHSFAKWLSPAAAIAWLYKIWGLPDLWNDCKCERESIAGETPLLPF